MDLREFWQKQHPVSRSSIFTQARKLHPDRTMQVVMGTEMLHMMAMAFMVTVITASMMTIVMVVSC